MRLAVLTSGHDRPTTLFLGLMKRLTRSELPQIVWVTCYRHRFFGTPFSDLVHDVMRGPSFWTVGERELFAAYTSKTNDCPFCATAHRWFAGTYAGHDLIDAALDSPDTAPIRGEAKAVLTFLEKLSREPDAVTGADVKAVREAGVDATALDQAVRITVLFHVINRVMNAVGAGPLVGRERAVGTQFIRRLGYGTPPPVRLLSRAR